LKIGFLLKGDKRSTREVLEDFLNLKSRYPSEQVFEYPNPTVLPIVDIEEYAEFIRAVRDLNQRFKLEQHEIAGSGVTVLNVTICPSCQSAVFLDDIVNAFDCRLMQDDYPKGDLKGDRITCRHCGSQLQPTLFLWVKSNAEEALERIDDFSLCDQIEGFFEKKGKAVLSRKQENVIKLDEKRVAIINDIDIEELAETPVVLINLLARTPAALVITFMQRENLQRKDTFMGGVFFKNRVPSK
jgi:hypothetical protein